MAFSAKQLQALRRQPNWAHIRTRETHGCELSYLEGWYAISPAPAAAPPLAPATPELIPSPIDKSQLAMRFRRAWVNSRALVLSVVEFGVLLQMSHVLAHRIRNS